MSKTMANLATSITVGGFTFEIDKKYTYQRPAVQEISEALKTDCLRILYSSMDNKIELPEDFDWSWAIKGKDKYGLQGSITKRISAWYFKNHKYQVSDINLSYIGQLISESLVPEELVYFDLANDLEKPSDYFYNGGSCWWGSESAGRYYLVDLGGGAVRRLNKDGSVIGRCWFAPIDDTIVLFNNYGNDTLFNYARMLATIAGLSYRKIKFIDSNDFLYINSSSNFVVGTDSALNHLSDTIYTDKLIDSLDYTLVYCDVCRRDYPRNRIGKFLNASKDYGVCLNCVKV